MTRLCNSIALGVFAAAFVFGCGDFENDSPLTATGAAKADRSDCRPGELDCETEDLGALCRQLQEDSVEIQYLGAGTVVTKENWKTIDVLANMDYRLCHDAISQQKIEVAGKILWQFISNEDDCDGGAPSGSIYTEDLKTAVAHIDDGIHCEGWEEEDLAKNHRCDLGAEVVAQQKMEAFGLTFEVLDSSLELRDPYTYSYVDVVGLLPDHGNREAKVRVLTNLDNCTYDGSSIVELPLD